jgi:hypothetical protein
MGPILRVPDDVAQRLEEDTDLVDTIVMADAVDQADVEFGPTPGVFLLLTETPKDGFGGLAAVLAASAYAQSHPQPLALTVRDHDGTAVGYSGGSVSAESIHDHLTQAYFGGPGDRRPLIGAGDAAHGPRARPARDPAPEGGGRPISYEALEVGTSVASAGGTEFGTVEHVLQIPSLDLFDGIVVKTKHGPRFVARDQVADITTTVVRCALSDDEVATLPAPEKTEAVRPDFGPDEGHSLSAWYGRRFGRQHWKNLD